jgi:DNA-binding MarR family transcriptional regulator
MVKSNSLKLDAFLPYRLSVASNAVSDVIARAYRDLFGLKVPEWRLIAILAQSPGLTPQAIGARGQMDKITVSRAAHGLLERSLICARDNLLDKRSHCLELTATGIELYHAVVPAALKLERQIFGALNAAEIKLLGDLLRRVEQAAVEMSS